MRRDLQVGEISPNAGHRALVELSRQGRLRAPLTQNIDGLHQQAGSSPAIRTRPEAAAHCDLFMAVGTSLTVHPAAGLIDLAADAGARIVVVNAEPTPYDDIADLVVREPIGTALPRLLTGHP
jgi:NAD-dependent SIR2 family protein deacetylase